jgi:hypothetical protein
MWNRSRSNFKAKSWHFSGGTEEMPGKPRIITADIGAEISSRKSYQSTNTFGQSAEHK